MTLKLFVFTVKTAPYVMGLGSGIIRCAPPNMLAVFMRQCGPQLENWTWWLQFFLISIPNVIFWKVIIQSAVFACAHILVACICLDTILKGCFRSKILSNTLMYRTVGLLNNWFNESYSFVMSLIIFASTFTPTPLLSLLLSLVRTFGVTMGSGKPFSIEKLILVVCLAWLLGMATLVLVYVIGNVGSLYEVSGYGLKKSRSATLVSNENRVVKWQALFHKSCRPVKVAFGVSNFVEQTTPFKLFNCSFLMFVDILLGNNSK